MNHSWPLFDQGQRFDLGHVFEWPQSEAGALTSHASDEQALAVGGAGLWECDLADNKLTWSRTVYDIFGLPPGAAVTRKEAVALYADEFHAAMERLRAYAIRHRRGFTLDALIRPAVGRARWMRLIAAPICDDQNVVRLHGVKRLI